MRPLSTNGFIKYFVKPTAIVVLFSFFNLLIIDCSKKQPTEQQPDQNKVQVAENGIAYGTTDSQGTLVIESSQLGEIEITVSDQIGKRLPQIEITYYEYPNMISIYAVDPSGKYAGAFVWGNPAKLSTGLSKLCEERFGEIALKPHEPTIIPIPLILAVATISAYSNYVTMKNAVEQIETFWVTDEIYNEIGQKVGVVKTAEQIAEYIKAKIDYYVAFVSLISIPVTAGLMSLKTKTLGFVVGSFVEAILQGGTLAAVDFILDWYAEHKKPEWPEPSRDMKFLVKEYEGAIAIKDGLLKKFFGLDIEPYIEGTLPGEFKVDEHTVALWHFNEGSGNMAYDATNNHLNGTIHGATWTAEGRFGSALYFDGNHRYVKVSPFPDLGNKFTIEAWVKITDTRPQNPRIVSRYDNYELLLELSSRKVAFKVWKSVQTPTIYSQTSIDDLMNRWILITAVCTGDSIKLYIDGQLEASAALPIGNVLNTYPSIYIGERQNLHDPFVLSTKFVS